MTEESSTTSPPAEESPPIVARPATSARGARAWASLIAVGCASILALAAMLNPDPRGYGTHEQLSLGRWGSGPCGMLVMTGLPCPTCGMTTAFAHTVRGQWLRAAYVQPAGFVLALATIATLLACIGVIIRGRWPLVPWWRFGPHWVFWGLLIALVGGWAAKIVIGLADGTLPY